MDATPSRPSRQSRQRRYLRYLNDSSLSEPRTTSWRRRQGESSTPVGSAGSSQSSTPLGSAASQPSPSSGPGLSLRATSNPSRPASSGPRASPSPSPIPMMSTTPSPSYSSSPMMSATPSPDNIPPPTSRPRTSSIQPGADDYTQLLAPLYPGADITVCGAVCVIMKFCSSNKLSYAAISELLEMLLILCPAATALPASLYLFKKFFGKFSPIHTHQRICLACKSSCDTCSCVATPRAPWSTADLVHLDIDQALETVVARNWQAIQDRKSCSSNGRLEDIWDGSVLCALSEPGKFFADRNNLALSLSTDGVALYKSSPISIWPVYLAILNIPANIRMNAENVIICGVWVGPTKPVMDLLLDPIADCLERLSSVGLDIQSPTGSHTCRAKLVMGVFDLPAKAAVLCAKQFNGKYGCSVCLHPGDRLANNARVYLPGTVYPERTHAGVLAAGLEAEEKDDCVEGVFFVSPMASILDLVLSFPVDHMHNVLEGAAKWLLNAWFDSKNHAAPFYIGRHLRAVDAQLLNQRPPCEFSRPPRSIRKHSKYWKASELGYWLLYYSLPILVDFLPSLYWHHYSLLVTAVHILLSDSISTEMVQAAEKMLHTYYLLLPELYGQRSCTANAHLLSHLTKFVRLWGPLWTQSAFGFESKNGQLRHLFHSNTEIHHQLLFNIDVSHTLQRMYAKLVVHESDRTLTYLNCGRSKRTGMLRVSDHTYFVGKRVITAPTSEQATALGSPGQIEVCYRLLKNGIFYYSTLYQRRFAKRSNTHCLYLTDSGTTSVGIVTLFTNNPPCAIIKPLQTSVRTLIDKVGPPCRPVLVPHQTANLISTYIIPVSDNASPLVAVPVQRIKSKVCVISVPSGMYCVVQPNSIERH